MLKATVKPGNPQLSHDVTIKTLPDGISRKQSPRWQAIADRLCLHSPWQGRIKKSETGKSGNSHRLLTTRLNEVSEWLECSLHKLILFNNCLVPISQHSMNALTSSACTVV